MSDKAETKSKGVDIVYSGRGMPFRVVFSSLCGWCSREGGEILPLDRLRRDEESVCAGDCDTRVLSATAQYERVGNAAVLECIIVILELCSPSRCCRNWIVRM